MGWRRLTSANILCGSVLVFFSMGSASAEVSTPWTPERVAAVVRVEVPGQSGSNPIVGTGFVVKGKGGRYYVMTSTHVVLPKHDSSEALPKNCQQPIAGTRLFRINTRGPELFVGCVYHLGQDVSLLEVLPGAGSYPILGLSTRDEFAKGESLFLAGFPLGYNRDDRDGKVTELLGPDGTIITSMETAEGMSGGPYLDMQGNVVGIHLGGGRYTAGFAHAKPIWRLKTELQDLLVLDQPVAVASSELCIREKLRELLDRREAFSYQDGITCSAEQRISSKLIRYTVRENRPDYAIAGFASHTDDVKNGFVGMLRYSEFEGTNTLAVEIPVECDISAQSGHVKIKIFGSLRRIDNKNAHDEAAKACGGR